jgi:hypothetical protein
MSELPVPRCEPVDDERFLFVHNCLHFDMVDGALKLVTAPADPSYLPLEREGVSGWVWIGEPGATIHPSINCSRCKTHGFWRDGAWQPV